MRPALVTSICHCSMFGAAVGGAGQGAFEAVVSVVGVGLSPRVRSAVQAARVSLWRRAGTVVPNL